MAWPLSVLLGVVCLGVTGCTPGGVRAQAVERPNIVLILADDLGYGDIGAFGGEIIQTPHIDRLAETGVRFTQGYVSHPVCSPSRAGLITGRYQQRHGWEFNPAGRDAEAGMSLDERTIADELKALGYATGMVGKWHLGKQRPYQPMSRGFDEYFGVLDGGSSFIDPSLPGNEYAPIRGEGPPPVRHNKQRGFEPVEVDGYLTDVFTDEAVGFIERQAEVDAPFFLYLAHTTPHTPLQATTNYLEPYAHLDSQPMRVYAAMVASLDESVRRVMETLEATGQADNTLVVFLSDNGCAGYVLNACSNGPFAGFKRYHQEGGVRVPFVMRWPEGMPAGETYALPVSALDLMATFTAAAGGAVATEDSVDLRPFVNGQVDEPPHEYLFWRAGPTVAVRDDRWKLIRYNRTELGAADLDRTGRLTPPPGGWPSGSPHGQLTLLFDLDADPSETDNLATQNPDIVERLSAAVAAWSAELGQPIQPAVRSTLAEFDGEVVQLVF